MLGKGESGGLGLQAVDMLEQDFWKRFCGGINQKQGGETQSIE